MPQTLKGDRVPIRIWARPEEVEGDALRQLRALTRLPWVAHHVAVMPDVHVGKGTTVGTVVALRGAVVPAAVGVDIGCGMAAVKTNLTAGELPDSLRALRLAVEAAIPVGHRQHGREAWLDAPVPVRTRCQALLSRFDALDPAVRTLRGRASLQLGSLGGGNHFVELCLDERQGVWLLLHSGSRHIGAALAERHMERARHQSHNQALSDPELAAFLAGTPTFDAYRRDLFWAQEYAELNRQLMLSALERTLAEALPQATFELAIACCHNYVSEERHFGEDLLVTRKGAIRAGRGELGIVPGSMGSKSFIVRGLGNPQSFESASHGAGRRLSRGQARRSFRLADLERQTAGVECRKDAGVLDEAPKAYKNIERVMEQQRDLVEIVTELKQVLCVKG